MRIIQQAIISVHFDLYREYDIQCILQIVAKQTEKRNDFLSNTKLIIINLKKIILYLSEGESY